MARKPDQYEAMDTRGLSLPSGGLHREGNGSVGGMGRHRCVDGSVLFVVTAFHDFVSNLCPESCGGSRAVITRLSSRGFPVTCHPLVLGAMYLT